MSKRKQRIVLEGFTVSVGKLVIEQDSEATFTPFEDGVRQALGQVMSAPAQLLATPTDSNGSQLDHEERPAQVLTEPKRRRRPSRAGGTATSPNGEAKVVSGAKAYVLDLKSKGYFQQERPVNEILEKLHEVGHTTVKPQALGMALLHLTREQDLAKKLYRRKGAKDQWFYRDTSYDAA